MHNIPTPIDKEKHQLHRECYLKFTLVNSKKHVEKSEMRKNSSRSPSGGLSKLNNSLLKPRVLLKHFNIQKILFEKFASKTVKSSNLLNIWLRKMTSWQKKMLSNICFFAQSILLLAYDNTYIWKMDLVEAEQIVKLDYYLRLQNTKILP